jgi:phosphatidylglycerol:prolipoprotein diacylglycerol transferase
MLTFPNISPVALDLGFFKIHWYGLMYLGGILAAWHLANIRRSKFNENLTKDDIADLVFYVSMGIILGGRIGYALFYDFAAYINDWTKIFRVWEGGMAFHGGLLGVLFAVFLFCRHKKLKFLSVMDFIAPLVPIGLGLGRIGNFINSELWGKTTDGIFGMIFPNGGPLPRHPSQLYQAFLEGLLLFIILYLYTGQKRHAGSVCGLFAVCYGIFRFMIEFIRVPDSQLGYLAFNWLTMGQLLSIPMILAGLAFMFYAQKTQEQIWTR